MKVPDEEEKPLPQFRKDLQLYVGPVESDGTPTYNIYDPVKVQYYKISWSEGIILQYLKPGMTLSELIREVEKHTTLRVTQEDVIRFFMQAKELNLLAGARASEQVEEEAERIRSNPLKWLLTHYLYFRVPLFKPDAFLEKTLHLVTPFASRFAIAIYTFITFIGLIFLFNRLDEYFSTFTYFFNLNGVIIYAVAVTGVKIIHELAHAYTAKYYKTNVASMGVAFLIFWPVLYTDVTDSWKLASRRQRLWITAAGVISEITIAGLCTFGWALSEPGLVQSLFFVLSSATWLATLAINLNPAMRWDGYYLLSDLWGIDNLQQRAFAVTRWKMRKWLFGLDLPPPEFGLSQSRIRGMMIYSIYTWIYRLILYTTIAIFVYYAFTKALGVALFILEILLLIVWPIYDEIKTLYKLGPYFTRNVHVVFTILVVSILLLWFVLPLPRTKWFPAITVPLEEQVLYVSYSSEIERIFVERGDFVKKGEPVIELRSEQLNNEILQLESEKEILERQMHIFSLENSGRSQIPETQKELEKIENSLQTLKEKRRELTIRAEIDGWLYLWDTRLRAGQFLKNNQVIGKIADLSKMEILTYVPENLIGDVSEGQKATFMFSNNNEKIEGRIRKIYPNRDEILTYPQLASVYEGMLPVAEEEGGKLYLIRAVYPVRISIPEGEEPVVYGMLGDVKVTTPPRSKFMTFFRWALSILWRESGL